jgi:uncharacterized protein YfiM (DUF2279 family)
MRYIHQHAPHIQAARENTVKTTTILAAALLTTAAQAQTTTERDALRFAGSGLVAAAVTLQTQAPLFSFAASIGAGLLMSAIDGRGRLRGRDVAIAMAGAAAGVTFGNVILTPRYIAYRSSF